MAPNPDKVVGEHVFLAARMGDAQTVTAWLDESGGVDARCTEFYGTTLLMAAALWEGTRRRCGCCCGAARASTCNTPSAAPP